MTTLETTLQARTWAHVAERATKPRDRRGAWAGARTALGFTLVGILLFAGFALRAIMFVHIS